MGFLYICIRNFQFYVFSLAIISVFINKTPRGNNLCMDGAYDRTGEQQKFHVR